MVQRLSNRVVDWREGRRLWAWELHEAGWKQSAISEALGVKRGAVSQWMRQAREGGGAAALRKCYALGAPRRLSAEQQAQVLAWLEEEPEAHGFAGELWRRKRVAVLIEPKLGVHYHPGHVSRAVAAVALESPEACTLCGAAQRTSHRAVAP